MIKKIANFFFLFLKLIFKYNLDILTLYILITFIYFYPVFGQYLKNFFSSTSYVIGSADTYNQFLPLRVFLSDNLKEGTILLWFDYQALGLPFLGIIQSGAFYPFNLIIFNSLIHMLDII